MADILHFLCVVFFITLIGQGNSCERITDLKVSQFETGKLVHNKPQRKVSILNDCTCTQLSIMLACDGFQTAENINSSILAVLEDGCHINGDQPVYGFQTFNFTYSWVSEYPFKPIYSEIACS